MRHLVKFLTTPAEMVIFLGKSILPKICFGQGDYDTEYNPHPYFTMFRAEEGQDGNDYTMSEVWADSIHYGPYSPRLLEPQSEVLTKYDKSHQVKWSKFIFGLEASDIIGWYFVTDKWGNTYISINNIDYMDIGGTINTTIGDNFLVKVDSSGTIVWQRAFGPGPSQNFYKFGYGIGPNLCVDTLGNIYYASSALTGGAEITGNGDTLRFKTAYGHTNPFLVKFDSSGTPLWMSYFGGADESPDYYSSQLRNLIVDKAGNIYMAGNFSGRFYAGKDTVNSYATTIENINTGFITAFNSRGTILWAKGIATNIYKNTNFNAGLLNISGGENNSIYFTGQFNDTAEFDTILRTTPQELYSAFNGKISMLPTFPDSISYSIPCISSDVQFNIYYSYIMDSVN